MLSHGGLLSAGCRPVFWHFAPPLRFWGLRLNQSTEDDFRLQAPTCQFYTYRDPGKLIDFPSQIVHGSTVRFEGEPCSG
jgi:hypothetical protein